MTQTDWNGAREQGQAADMNELHSRRAGEPLLQQRNQEAEALPYSRPTSDDHGQGYGPEESLTAGKSGEFECVHSASKELPAT